MNQSRRDDIYIKHQACLLFIIIRSFNLILISITTFGSVFIAQGIFCYNPFTIRCIPFLSTGTLKFINKPNFKPESFR